MPLTFRQLSDLVYERPRRLDIRKLVARVRCVPFPPSIRELAMRAASIRPLPRRGAAAGCGGGAGTAGLIREGSLAHHCHYRKLERYILNP